MAYRLYFMNREGHIARVKDFDAADDVKAIALSDADGTRPKELWCSNRRVEQWSAEIVRE